MIRDGSNKSRFCQSANLPSQKEWATDGVVLEAGNIGKIYTS